MYRVFYSKELLVGDIISHHDHNNNNNNNNNNNDDDDDDANMAIRTQCTIQ